MINIIGLILLCALFAAAGVWIGDRRNEFQRRRLAARRWQVWLLEQEILNLAEFRGCAACELLRRRAELQRSPTEW